MGGQIMSEAEAYELGFKLIVIFLGILAAGALIGPVICRIIEKIIDHIDPYYNINHHKEDK